MILLTLQKKKIMSMPLLDVFKGRRFLDAECDLRFLYVFDNGYMLEVTQHDDTPDLLYEVEFGLLLQDDVMKYPIDCPLDLKQTSYITDSVVNSIILDLQNL